MNGIKSASLVDLFAKVSRACLLFVQKFTPSMKNVMSLQDLSTISDCS